MMKNTENEMQTKTKTVYRVTNSLCAWSSSFKTLKEARECAKTDPRFKAFPSLPCKAIIEKITTITTKIR